MKNDTKAVWDRYVSSWNVTSPSEKQALFAQSLSPDCVYADPLGQTKGWAELSEHMAGFHAQVPGGKIVTEYFLAHHGQSVARWQLLNEAEQPIGNGISYAKYDAEQRLVAMTAFFDTPGAAPDRAETA